MICGFSYYLDQYYRTLWVPFYALPIDTPLLRGYAIVVLAILLVPLPLWPKYWFLMMNVPYVALYLKKRHTRDAFSKALDDLPSRRPPTNRDLARHRLALAFTRLWLRNGVIVMMVYSSIHFSILRSEFSFRFRISTYSATIPLYLILSIVFVVSSSLVWITKGTTHLHAMAKRVKKGDYAYFDTMDL
jgi:hypothetical protein